MKLFENSSLQKVFLQIAVKECLRTSKRIKIENEKAVNAFFNNVKHYVLTHPSKFLYTTMKEVNDGFLRYNIHTAIDLICEINDNREVLSAQGYHVENIYDPKETIKKMNIKSYNSISDIDVERTLVVRSKFGGTKPLFYKWTGPIQTNATMHAICLDYHYKTGCPYYEARPILYSTWKNLPEEQQLASSKN